MSSSIRKGCDEKEKKNGSGQKNGQKAVHLRRCQSTAWAATNCNTDARANITYLFNTFKIQNGWLWVSKWLSRWIGASKLLLDKFFDASSWTMRNMDDGDWTKVIKIVATNIVTSRHYCRSCQYCGNLAPFTDSIKWLCWLNIKYFQLLLSLTWMLGGRKRSYNKQIFWANGQSINNQEPWVKQRNISDNLWKKCQFSKVETIWVIFVS